jgi:hypothetical protein
VPKRSPQHPVLGRTSLCSSDNRTDQVPQSCRWTALSLSTFYSNRQVEWKVKTAWQDAAPKLICPKFLREISFGLLLSFLSIWNLP